MTAIVIHKKSKNKCIVGADRRLTLNENGYFGTDPQPKIRKIGKAIVGGCGAAAVMTLFFHLKELKNLDKTNDLDSYMYNTILPALKKNLEKHGHMGVHTEDPEASVFVVFKGHCYEIDIGIYSLDCVEMPLPHGMGCGGAAAKHCLDLVTHRSGFANREHIIASLEYAASVNSGCDDNIDVLSE